LAVGGRTVGGAFLGLLTVETGQWRTGEGSYIKFTMTRMLIPTLVIFLLCIGNPVDADCTGCTDNGCTCIGPVGQLCDQSHCTIRPRCDAGGCNQDGTTRPVCCLGYCSQVNATGPKCRGGHCNQDGATDGPVCTGGECSQVGAESPVCTGGDCDQSNSVSPKCTGGSCTQTKARGKAKCVGGSCNTAGAEAVNCLGGNCCLDGTEKSVSCLGGSCNSSAKSCNDTGCGGSLCDNTFPASGLQGTCNRGGDIVYPNHALQLLVALVLMVVLYRQCKSSSPRQNDDDEPTSLQQPLLVDQNGSEDPPSTNTAENSEPMVDAESNQPNPMTTVTAAEEQEVTGGVRDTKSVPKKN